MVVTRRVYPHVGQVKDRPAGQSLHLLWDRLFDVEERLKTQTASLDQATEAIEALAAELDDVARKVDQALMQASRAATDPDAGEGGTDDGQGAVGCSSHTGSGHPGTGLALTAATAGEIVCGTGAEFPALLAATPDLPTREANALQLLRRMIWHLNQYGYTAGRQRNPSGLLSKDKLSVQIPGEATYRAYDVFFSFDSYATAMGTQMAQVFPPNYDADGGIAD
jgi:hypothetical protein